MLPVVSYFGHHSTGTKHTAVCWQDKNIFKNLKGTVLVLCVWEITISQKH